MSANQPSSTALRSGALVATGALILGLVGGYVARGGSDPSAAGTPAPSASESRAPESSGSESADPTTQPVSTSTSAGAVDAAFQQAHDFYGDNQAGVETPSALHQSFLGFDLVNSDRDTAEAVLRLVSDDAARLMNGEPALGDLEPEIAKRPAGLTITVGLGRDFYKAAKASPPEQLREIPDFSTDQLQEDWAQTDFVVQIGSNDPLSLSHASRMIVKDLRSLADLSWRQDGFRSGADLIPGYDEPRNLLGQVDGIVNPEPGSDQFDRVVWNEADDVTVDGGTVLVLRRIKLLTDKWDTLDLAAQDQVMGRERDTGAPVGANPGDDMPFDEVDEDGLPVISDNAHARVAHAASDESMILRRPYNYDAGVQADGSVEVGLLFAAYMRDPATSFIPMQEMVSQMDAFNEWNTTIGSSTYFVLPGAAPGEFLGQGLFS